MNILADRDLIEQANLGYNNSSINQIETTKPAAPKLKKSKTIHDHKFVDALGFWDAVAYSCGHFANDLII